MKNKIIFILIISILIIIWFQRSNKLTNKNDKKKKVFDFLKTPIIFISFILLVNSFNKITNVSSESNDIFINQPDF